jgi:hypothetical protein
MKARLAHFEGTDFALRFARSGRSPLEVSAEELHFDDQRSDMNPEPIFNWRRVYGFAADIQDKS